MAVGKFATPINAASGGGGINYSVSVFTSSGTYTKPSDLDYCYVLMVGGGSGGGAGRRGAASSNRASGYGCNSGIILAKFNNSELSATETVTIGAGGAGGAAQTTNDTNGAAGTLGGATQFKYGVNFASYTGAAASGATSIISFNNNQNANRATSGNRQSVLFTNHNNRVLGTTTSSDESRGNSNTAGNRWVSPFCNVSVGGQITSSNVRENAGQLSGFYDDTNTLINEISGTAPEANGAQPTSFYTFGQYLAKLFPWFDSADANYNIGRGGLGGGCGDTAGTIAGGTGAAALGYGAGGGGGGASTNGANSGAGGAGTGGIVIIINVLT